MSEWIRIFSESPGSSKPSMTEWGKYTTEWNDVTKISQAAQEQQPPRSSYIEDPVQRSDKELPALQGRLLKTRNLRRRDNQ